MLRKLTEFLQQPIIYEGYFYSCFTYEETGADTALLLPRLVKEQGGV